MKVRYKSNGAIAYVSSFNMTTTGEVLTGDDSAYIAELEVFLEKSGEWKDMRQAFRDHDLITNDANTSFFEPENEKDKVRGFSYS